MTNTPKAQAGIGDGQTVNIDAAVNFIHWRAAIANACGVWVTWTQGTRTWQEQYRLWDGWRRKLPGFNPAWHPDDPKATHLAGESVDVGSQVGYINTLVSKTAHALAPQFGIEFDVPGEPWHAHRVRPYNPPKLPTPTQEEEDMKPYMLSAADRGQILMLGSQPVKLGSPEETKRLTASGIETYVIDPATYDRILYRAWG